MHRQFSAIEFYDIDNNKTVYFLWFISFHSVLVGFFMHYTNKRFNLFIVPTFVFSSFVISEPMRVTNIREGTAPAAGEVSIITHTHTYEYLRTYLEAISKNIQMDQWESEPSFHYWFAIKLLVNWRYACLVFIAW